MDKRDYAIIGLLVVIIAMLSYGVYNSYVDSQPEVFDFSDFKVTAPAGSHYHENINRTNFYLTTNDSMPIFIIGNIAEISAEDFNEIVNTFNNGEISKSDLIDSMNEGFVDGGMKVLDINVGDFRGEPEISVLCQNPYDGTKTVLMHLILHNNDRVFIVLEFMDNPASTAMYNSLQLK